MVGPNGAGKTTTIECIEGLRKPDKGMINVLGLNPAREKRKLYHLIGVQLQETSYQDRVKVSEICKLFTSLYHNPLPYAKLLTDFELAGKSNAYVSTLSGGQRQRLSIILALIGNPRILFLDEITTGLDPQARHAMWGVIEGLRIEGRTIFLTTHYMEEAENLCDRVCIIDRGRIIALDTVANLIRSSGIEETLIFTAREVDLETIESIENVSAVRREGHTVTVLGHGRDLSAGVINTLYQTGTEFSELSIKKPNLEDVFLKLTGHRIRE